MKKLLSVAFAMMAVSALLAGCYSKVCDKTCDKACDHKPKKHMTCKGKNK